MKHCWHSSQMQHMTPNHDDVFCCWCTKERCMHLDGVQPEDHGPAAPEVYYRPYDDEECPERLPGKGN